MGNSRFCTAVLVALLLSAPAAWAGGGGDPNACDAEGDAPDVIVGDLPAVNSYGNIGDIYAYSVATTSCNIGTCWLNWFSNNSDHPVIGQNMYRYKDGRIEQIGQSWLKHGFFALSESLCDSGCLSTSGTHLGVNCSDPYTAGLNGQQSNLGPRFEVNAASGLYPYPHFAQGQSGDTIYKRLQVHADDLDPALNPGATYFVEGQYISADDAQAGNGTNNNSWREISLDGNYDASVVGETVRQKSGVQIWADQETGVKETVVTSASDGAFIIAAKSSDNGDGTFHFEYAIQNLTSDRSGQAFWVPAPGGSTVTGIGFHDVDYHSGEPYDNTDWVMFHDTANNRVLWQGPKFDDNPNGNALRWGTTYNFWFDIDVGAKFGSVMLDLFKPGTGPGDPDTLVGSAFGPNPCNSNGICEAEETCANCAEDCISSGPPTGFCGDLICEEALAEDCLSCPGDCAGMQGGNPGLRYCCGDGGGTNPVPCSDFRCNTGGFTCDTTGVEFCCGDGSCDLSEDSCLCAEDCGAPPAKEFTCADGEDNDCDGNTDCNDLDCCTDASCFTGVDNDLDGVADCDCDDGDSSIWESPSEATALTLVHDAVTGTTLTWNMPLNPGANSINYETLRTVNSADFSFAHLCLNDANPADQVTMDIELPATGTIFHYLVRATNDCPGGVGSGDIGRDSEDVQRDSGTCP